MVWTVRIEETLEGEPTVSHEILSVSRPERIDGLGQLGLSLSEAKTILRELQQKLVDWQVGQDNESRRSCGGCGERRCIKDYRSRSFDTLFGRVEARVARHDACCHCGAGIETAATGLRGRSTPELDARRSELAALVPYRQACKILSRLLPVSGGRSYSTVRRHTLRVGQRFAAELRRVSDTQEHEGTPAQSLALGLDTGYIKAVSSKGKAKNSVVVGHLQAPDGTHRHFGTVRKADEPQDELQARLHQMGYHPDTEVTVLTDGEEGLGRLASRALGKPVAAILDWFHIAMPLDSIERSAKSLKAPGAAHKAAAEKVRSDLERLHWRLWHGQLHKLDDSFDQIRTGLRAYTRGLDEERAKAVVRKINCGLYEFERYVRSKSTRIVNYARRQRQGQPISTAPTESTVQNLLNRRMDSKQQMRWSPTGANYLIQVRAAVLNNEFDDLFQRSLENAGGGKKTSELRSAA